jgi:hypothetical protein
VSDITTFVVKNSTINYITDTFKVLHSCRVITFPNIYLLCGVFAIRKIYLLYE